MSETVNVYDEQREVLHRIEIEGQEYRVAASGLRRLAYFLVGPRGGLVELHRGIRKGEGYLMPMDKSGRRMFGRTVFVERDGGVQVAKVVA